MVRQCLFISSLYRWLIGTNAFIEPVIHVSGLRKKRGGYVA